MFANLSWEHILVLVVVGLVILGPERLPGAIRWTGNALRQARDYLSGVTSQLREDLGPEFDDLRGPISELQKLRGMSPRAALTKHLLDGDDSFLTGNFERPVSGAPNGAGLPAPTAAPQPGPAAAERRTEGPAPFDTDAT
jgi:sec-independent protein translocase protein TatB